MKNDLTAVKLFLVGVFISSLIFSPFLLDFTLVPRLLCISLFSVITVYLLFRSGFSAKLKVDLILLAYFLYTLFCCLSVFWSTNTSEALFESSKIVLSFFVFLLTYFSLKQQKEYFIEKLSKGSIVVFLIAFAFGIYQYCGVTDTLYQVSGLNGHKNLFSSFLFLNFFFLLVSYFQLSKNWKTASFICIFLSIVLIFLLKTKAVWFGAGITVLSAIIIYAWNSYFKHIKIHFVVSLIVLLVLANVLFMFCLQPIIQKEIASVTNTITKTDVLTLEQERLVLWDKTYHMIKKHPLTGVGMGNWQIHFPDATLSGLWRAEDLNYTFQRPHNDFLWILSETGFIGLNLFLIFLFSIVLLLLKAVNKLVEKDQVVYATLCVAFVIGFYSISFFDFPKERIEHLIWINILLGISYHAIRENTTLVSFTELMINRTIYRVSLFLLAFTCFVGVLRYKGEYFTRQMYDCKAKNDNNGIISNGKWAWSFFYTIDPTSVPIYWYIGNANANIGNYLDAQTNFLQAYSYNPYNRNVLNDLASSYAFNNQIEEAKIKYRGSSRISPRFDDPKLNLAALYIREKNFDAAISVLNSLMHDSERRDQYKKIIELQRLK